MSLTQHVFPQFSVGVATGVIALTGGTYKVALSNAVGPITLDTSGVSTAKTFSDWKSNVAAEITGTGYTAGGVTLSSPTLTLSGTDNTIVTWTTASNPNWTTATFSANQAIFYESSASTYQLICFWDNGGSVPVTGGTFTLTIGANGIMTAAVS
jgi:hypothetical protein